MLRTIPPHRKVAAVDARAIHTRCVSSNIRWARAPKDSCASARIRLITPDCSPSSRPTAQERPPRVSASPTDRSSRSSFAQGEAFLDVRFDRDHLADGQLAIMEGRNPTPDRRTGQERHACLSCARRLSRARARRDLTVPTAMPSE